MDLTDKRVVAFLASGITKKVAESIRRESVPEAVELAKSNLISFLENAQTFNSYRNLYSMAMAGTVTANGVIDNISKIVINQLNQENNNKKIH